MWLDKGWLCPATFIFCLGLVQSTELDMERVILQFMCIGSLASVTYLRYTVLTSPNKGETAVHCCDPPLSVLVMLVSRNVFHVVSALQSIVLILFWGLIRSLADPTLAALIVCGPLQLVTHFVLPCFLTKNTS